MLRGLSIRDMLLIDRLDLEFQPGLNVLTGETGAGKSILLDSLGFVLGWRGRADLVREGADLGEVTAEFDLPGEHPVRAILDEAGLPFEGELFLRRTSARDGRRQAFVNDRRCPVETLRRISDTLIELHGQQDDRGLLNPGGHRALLDAFAALGSELADVQAAWSGLAAARKALEGRRTRQAQAEKDRDFLKHAVDELDKLDPQPDEDAALDARRRLMQAGARLREDIARADAALGQDGADGLLGDAQRWLEGAGAATEGRLDDALAALSRAREELDHAQRGVADVMAMLDFEPLELERIEERLFAIRALARKHGVTPDALGELADKLRSDLAAIETGAADIMAFEKALKDAEARYAEVAEKLGAGRRNAAKRLDKAMVGELGPLKMERAVFTTQVVACPAGPDGTEAVGFQVATNPGAPAGPLNRIASGGELSRFLLALKVCLAGRQDGLTMIFDEIDRGVGGATADAVGRRLASLGAQGQVLVVTHSPQVAAQGGHHWVVEKDLDDSGHARTNVRPLSGPERVAEIARMLAGEKVTDEARAAAEALLETV